MNSISNKTIMKNPRQDFCYHTHTKRCGHAEDVSDEQYVIKAIKGGIKRLAFTDHVPTPTPDYIKTTRKVRMHMSEVKSYLASGVVSIVASTSNGKIDTIAINVKEKQKIENNTTINTTTSTSNNVSESSNNTEKSNPIGGILTVGLVGAGGYLIFKRKKN